MRRTNRTIVHCASNNFNRIGFIPDIWSKANSNNTQTHAIQFTIYHLENYNQSLLSMRSNGHALIPSSGYFRIFKSYFKTYLLLLHTPGVRISNLWYLENQPNLRNIYERDIDTQITFLTMISYYQIVSVVGTKLIVKLKYIWKYICNEQWWTHI